MLYTYFKQLLKFETRVRMGTIDATAIFQDRNPELDIFVIVIFLVDTPFDPNPIDSKTPPSPCNPTVR